MVTWHSVLEQRLDLGILFLNMRCHPSLVSGVIVSSMFDAAIVAEIMRAGIQSVPKGQRKARVTDMTTFQELRYIVMPQAMRKFILPMANRFLSLTKESSIISLIVAQGLTFKALAFRMAWRVSIATRDTPQCFANPPSSVAFKCI